ncbi:MAG: cytidine/deoxycytidylate deaminase family protein [Candidatus Micrarchaeota archaeon]
MAEKNVRMEGQKHEPRESWDHYFMRLVDAIATRATCNRRKFGALLARDHFMLATGYNGSARGLPHCTEAGCKLIHGHCVRTIHAEQNAIISAARNGINVNGATLYSTAFPCLICAKILANLGIERIVYRELYYREEYREEFEFTKELFEQAGIETVQLG